MPEGSVVMKYNDKSGIEIKAEYPKAKLNITNDPLMNIFSLHEFSKKTGIANLTVGDVNITTYYTGVVLDYYIILVLTMLEDPDNYEEGLKETSQIILKNLNKDKYIEMFPSLFKRIST